MTIKTLAPPAFTEDEEALIVTDLLGLKKTQIGAFLSSNGFPKSGTKEELRSRIEKSLGDGTLSLSKIVQYLRRGHPVGKAARVPLQGPSSLD